MLGKLGFMLASLCLVVAPLAAATDEANRTTRDKQALAPLQPYVGQWRGVGLPKRGSNAGAWTETSEWAWRFKQGRAELVAQLKDDKYYKRLQVQPGEKPGQFVLLASAAGRDDEQPAAAPQRFTGALKDDVLVVTAETPARERPARISVRLVAGGDRMLVRYEKRIAEGVYARLAEVGSTRKGSSFAKNAASGPKCVVTGGLGTIAVAHDGKTYYVCCGGCRDLFMEDPQKVLAEYRQRQAAERAEDEM
jgi:ribosomal protein L24E